MILVDNMFSRDDALLFILFIEMKYNMMCEMA